MYLNCSRGFLTGGVGCVHLTLWARLEWAPAPLKKDRMGLPDTMAPTLNFGRTPACPPAGCTQQPPQKRTRANCARFLFLTAVHTSGQLQFPHSPALCRVPQIRPRSENSAGGGKLRCLGGQAYQNSLRMIRAVATIPATASWPECPPNARVRNKEAMVSATMMAAAALHGTFFSSPF